MKVMRKTKSVKILLEAFGNSRNALPVVDLVRQFQNSMNKTTVYRILDRLEDQGLLHSFVGKDGLKWVARCQGNVQSNNLNGHPHFQCKQCGKTECLTIEVSIPSVPNHRIDSTNLLLIGQCEDCLS